MQALPGSKAFGKQCALPLNNEVFGDLLSAIECADALDALEMADIVARDALLSKRLHQEELDAVATAEATGGKRWTTRQLLNDRVKGMLGQPHDVLATSGGNLCPPH